MSTPCELIVHAPKPKADSLATAILKETKRIEAKYNYYDPTSLLSAINSRKTDQLDEETIQILQEAKAYYLKTEKIFDVTIATIKEALGASTLKEFYELKKRLMEYVGCEHFKIEKKRIRFDNPYTKIDLGGYAKEYAIDRARRILRRHKIPAAIVNFGGDLYLHGERTFRIGIKDPNDPSRFIRYIEAKECAIATSAHYERYHIIEGEQISHILAKERLSLARSVTVIAENATAAGVWSTALAIKSCLDHHYRAIIIY